MGRSIERRYACVIYVSMLALITLAPLAIAEERKAGVLILHSNQRPTPAGVVVDETLRSEVPVRLDAPVQLFSEYLDDEWAALKAYGGAEAEFVRRKYDGRNIRVIVASALPALQFAVTFRDQMLPGVPIVHLAVPRDVLARLALPDNVFGKDVDLDPAPTLDLAMRLQPDTRRVVFVLGAAERDRVWERRLRGVQDRVREKFQFEYLTGLPTPEVLRRVASLRPGTIVFTPGYFSDGSGEIVTPRDSVATIAQASSVPVYGPLDTFLGTGVIGGDVTPYEEQARAAAALVVDLLKGTPDGALDHAPVQRVPMVDWRQLRRWDIPERLLPDNAVIQFREASVWERYRTEIALALGVIVMQAVLIAGLLLQRRRRRRAEEASSTLAGRLLTAHEDERRRLARDLHDDVTQRLARLAIDAGRMERGAGAAESDKVVRSLRDDLVRLSEDVHALSYQLHPSVLEDLGLAEGLRTECARLARQEPISVDVALDGVPDKVAREPSLCLFRVAQEALRNVVRHANAKAVTLTLTRHGRGLKLMVSDDGQGFDTSRVAARRSLGQISMRERVRLLGGWLDIAAAPGRGTTVVAWVPLEETSP